MSVRMIHGKSQKIIQAEDTLTELTDAIADVMLLVGGDEDKLEEAIEQARGSAETHYEAEKGGDSDGYAVLVDPQDREHDIMPLAEWVARQNLTVWEVRFHKDPDGETTRGINKELAEKLVEQGHLKLDYQGVVTNARGEEVYSYTYEPTDAEKAEGIVWSALDNDN